MTQNIKSSLISYWRKTNENFVCIEIEVKHRKQLGSCFFSLINISSIQRADSFAKNTIKMRAMFDSILYTYKTMTIENFLQIFS